MEIGRRMFHGPGRPRQEGQSVPGKGFSGLLGENA
jgi:hypothetical protein